ncbi:chaplin ChpH [Streptomyces sp. NBC_01190]|uniref:chaplin ChpH n=1 Tax=Streptomyces sp. NBC_01190 TaxID=2903767 RepID=UPI0038678239|nr:chaplin ChpH [Streptomyces sp. NBC_01190]
MIKKVVAIAAATGGLVLAGAGLAVADSGAQGAAAHSPGVLSGNAVQIPVHVPVNACGNTASVIGLLNPTFGNSCLNG